MAEHQPGPRAGARAADRRAVRARQRRRPEATPPRGDRVAGLARRPARPDLAGPVAGQRGRRRRRGVARRSRAVAARERPILAARADASARRSRSRSAPTWCAPAPAGWWPRCPAGAPWSAAWPRPVTRRDSPGCGASASTTRTCPRRPARTRCIGPRSSSAPRAACSPRSPSATSWSCSTSRPTVTAARWAHATRVLPDPAPAGDLLARPRRPGCRSCAAPVNARPRSSSTGSTWPAGRCATCWSTTCANAHRRWTTAACARWPPTWATCSGTTSNATIPASTACTYRPRSPPRGSSGCAPGEDGHHRRRREDDDHTVERLGYRQCLTPVRAFYLDLAQWALEDPARWAPWVAPCPIGEEEINQRKAPRRRKSRMDARTRQRLPVLPILVRSVEQRRKTTTRSCRRPANPARATLRRRRPDLHPLGHHRARRQGLDRRPDQREAARPGHARKTTRSGPGPPSRS